LYDNKLAAYFCFSLLFVKPINCRYFNSVSFKTPSGKKVLLVENDGNATELFNIKHNGKWVITSLEAGSVGTYIW